jgi:hypothetical protein
MLLGDFTDDAIENMGRKRNNEACPQASQVHFGICHILKMKAIDFWVQKRHREGANIALEGLNEETVRTLIREMTLHQKKRREMTSCFILTSLTQKNTSPRFEVSKTTWICLRESPRSH